MKDIIINSMTMHLLVTMVFISFAVATGSFFHYALALFYVCITIKHAIDIADFEMSDLGETVRLCESEEFKKVDVYFYR